MAQTFKPLVLFHDLPFTSNQPKTISDKNEPHQHVSTTLSPRSKATTIAESRAITATATTSASTTSMDMDMDVDDSNVEEIEKEESVNDSSSLPTSQKDQIYVINNNNNNLNRPLTDRREKDTTSRTKPDLQALEIKQARDITTTGTSLSSTEGVDSKMASPGPVEISKQTNTMILQDDSTSSSSMAISPPSSYSSSSSGSTLMMMDSLAKSLSPARVDMHRKRIERMLQQNALMWWELVRYTRTIERKERELEIEREQFRPPGKPAGWGWGWGGGGGGGGKKSKIVHHYHHHHHHHHPSLPPLHPQQQSLASASSSSTSTAWRGMLKMRGGGGGRERGRQSPYELPASATVTEDRSQNLLPPQRPQPLPRQLPPQPPHSQQPRSQEDDKRQPHHGFARPELIARPVPVKPFATPSSLGPQSAFTGPTTSSSTAAPLSSSSTSAPNLQPKSVAPPPPPPLPLPQPSSSAASPAPSTSRTSNHPDEDDESCNHQGGADGSNAHSEDQCPNAGSVDPNRKRRGNLPKSVTAVLKAWLVQHAIHPYPTEDQKQQLSEATNLSMNQISNWFINARRRILQPILVQAAAEAVAGTDAPMDNVLIVRKGKGSRMQVEMEGVVANANNNASMSSPGAGASL
ncbi:hypothetical protein BGZ83_000781 [Gryganskiella cystojenkinii]|nr:hypothetical protein BGZ83_000781 [Gryganskiella cystojenkinii]